jgi:prevent-host-death family protein
MTVSQFNLAEAKAHFSELVRSAMRGEEVIVANENPPVVRSAPVTPALRRPGTGKGVRISTDFDGPLDDFEGYR